MYTKIYIKYIYVYYIYIYHTLDTHIYIANSHLPATGAPASVTFKLHVPEFGSQSDRA